MERFWIKAISTGTKNSGCLFISLSLIKPNCLLKIVLVPYANRQGMMQQAGNETGKWGIPKLLLCLPRGLGKVSVLCFGLWSLADRFSSCQEVFAAAWDVPALWSPQTTRPGAISAFMQTLLVPKPQTGLELPGWQSPQELVSWI